MSILAAENRFKRGLAKMLEGRYDEALPFLEEAMTLEEQRSSRPQMRYLSYYGLARSLAEGVSAESLQDCRLAVSRSSGDPDLYLNLGRVYALAGRRTLAVRAFKRGLTIAPRHAVLLEALENVDLRQAPAIGVLPRSSPINRWLGRRRDGRGVSDRGAGGMPRDAAWPQPHRAR